MSLRVAGIDTNDRQGTIIIEADGQEEAQSAEAKQLALKTAAANGLTRPGLSGGESTYPVDANGETDNDLVMGRGVVAAYRCDYKVTAGL